MIQCLWGLFLKVVVKGCDRTFFCTKVTVCILGKVKDLDPNLIIRSKIPQNKVYHRSDRFEDATFDVLPGLILQPHLC